MIRTSHDAPETPRATDWRASAACLTEPASLFFPDGTTGPWLLAIEEAKAVCRRCPVADACLTFALDTGATDGIFGGLTEKERAAVQRAAQRHGTPPEETAEKARQPRRERTLQTILDDNTTRLYGGHLAWTGAPKVGFDGQSHTGLRIAFMADRGRQPSGRVLRTCDTADCVLPAHIADDEERMRCGTRAGYHRHQRHGTEICGPCRQANTDAYNLLVRTGSMRVAV